MSEPTVTTTPDQRRKLQALQADQLANLQLSKLNILLQELLPRNRFYAQHLKDLSFPLTSLDQLARLPFTFKDQLADESFSPPFAANLTYQPSEYCRFHRTSGTRGKPLVVLDRQADWQWWIDTWQFVLDAAGIQPSDRIVLGFSFGPFIGFWSAFDACVARGALSIPTGGMSSISRLELIQSTDCNVLFCTPSYALHLAEVGMDNQLNVGHLNVDRIVVAGEPGGSIPQVRQRIESLWQARVIDHGGASEIGPWGYSDPAARGLYVIESEFIAEFWSVERGQPAGEGELAELVITTLGRGGCPVIRYRTGDLVRPSWNDDQDGQFVLLSGGVLGRADDMMIVRGVNLIPSSIEQILRSFPEIVEYRMTAYRQGEMDQVRIEIEDRLQQPQRVVQELDVRLGLRVEVECVPIGSLPRFDLKGKRFIDQRTVSA